MAIEHDPFGTVIHAIKVQSRVISALVLREIHTRYGHRDFGYLWEIAEHVAHILVLAIIFSLLNRSAPIGDSFTIFFATGVIPYLLFTHISGQVTSAVDHNRPLLSYPMVLPIDLMIARTLLEVVTTSLVIALFLAAGYFFKILEPIDSLLDMFFAFALITVIGMGFGMIVAVIFFYAPFYKTIHKFIMRPLFFLSGLFYIADNLPLEAQRVLYFNPILHIVEWVRSAFYTEYESQFLDKYFVASAAVLLLFFGLLVERLTTEKVRTH